MNGIYYMNPGSYVQISLMNYMRLLKSFYNEPILVGTNDFILIMLIMEFSYKMSLKIQAEMKL
jgi:hypothetical protein